jgi:hypothetical protein
MRALCKSAVVVGAATKQFRASGCPSFLHFSDDALFTPSYEPAAAPRANVKRTQA